MLKLFLLLMLLEMPVIIAAYLSRRKDENAIRENTKEEGGRGVLLEILSEVFSKAKPTAIRGGYWPSLYITALDECLRRLRRGENIDLDVASACIEGLGYHLEENDGVITVCEN